MATKEDATVYQLRVQIRGADPPIWRRVQVWESMTLGQLHRVLQIVMGWEDYHLHEFVIGRRKYGVPSPDDELPQRTIVDERSVLLNSVIERVGSAFIYMYDFGDDWLHDVSLEAIVAPEAGVRYPQCVAGQRSGPPEDAGGVYGYGEYLEALKDPENERHQEMLDWRGPFDPEAFSLENVNRQLRKSFRSGRPPRARSRTVHNTMSPELKELPQGVLALLQSQPARVERKRIRPDERVPIELNERERELIVRHSFADEELTRRLLVVPRPGAAPLYRYTLDELDDLAGFVAAEANHARDKKIRREWGRLYERIAGVLEGYTDEEE